MEAHLALPRILMSSDERDSADIILLPNNTSQTSVKLTQPTQPPGFLSQFWFDMLSFILIQATFPVVMVFGIVSNSLNLVVFLKIRLNDSVTSSFFALSVTDMICLSCALGSWLCRTLDKFDFPRTVNLYHVVLLITMYYKLALAASTLITTYIAIQRCCCVALPMKFKGFFTMKRNTAILCLTWIVSVIIFIPRQSVWHFREFWDPSTNSSWYGLWQANGWSTFAPITDVMGHVVLPVVTQIITIICMGILITSIRKSSKFRRKATSSVATVKDQEDDLKAKVKEIRVVKAVTCVTLMFILSNVLPISITVAEQSVPEFDHNQRYHNLFILMITISDLFQKLNASLNIFIYYTFNSAYRHSLLTIFRLDVSSRNGR